MNSVGSFPSGIGTRVIGEKVSSSWGLSSAWSVVGSPDSDSGVVWVDPVSDDPSSSRRSCQRSGDSI